MAFYLAAYFPATRTAAYRPGVENTPASVANWPSLRARRHVESRDENLRGVISGALARPHQIISIGRENRLAIKLRIERQARLVRAICAHQVQLIIRWAEHAGRIDDVPAIGVPIGLPVDVRVIGELRLGCQTGDVAIRIERERADKNLQQIVELAIASIDESLPVRREKGVAVIAGGLGDLDNVRPVRRASHTHPDRRSGCW